ncbi:MAG: hypothetical protein A2Y23_09965 [Clostridiales bacterium GWB2_37_7]|nr:MAG: hypothetical protein A2Y23_09965 [Clostridiales bacterium GWB2_37_7]
MNFVISLTWLAIFLFIEFFIIEKNFHIKSKLRKRITSRIYFIAIIIAYVFIEAVMVLFLNPFSYINILRQLTRASFIYLIVPLNDKN